MAKRKQPGVDKQSKGHHVPSRKFRRVERNREIGRLYAKGKHSMQDLADHYGLAKTTVWAIVNKV